MAPLVLGLTGGIGSGKSTVSALLTARGAVVIDLDAIARQLQQPGGALHGPMVERFGEGILTPDGTIDRPAVAAIVFNDAEALRDLNAITWPAIGAEAAARRAAQEDTDNIVILDIPLLVEGQRKREGADALAGVIVVDAPTDVAIARLVGQRGMDEDDARARVAAQASREERMAVADFVIDNSGAPEDLAREVDRCWEWVLTLRSP